MNKRGGGGAAIRVEQEGGSSINSVGRGCIHPLVGVVAPLQPYPTLLPHPVAPHQSGRTSQSSSWLMSCHSVRWEGGDRGCSHAGRGTVMQTAVMKRGF